MEFIRIWKDRKIWPLIGLFLVLNSLCFWGSSTAQYSVKELRSIKEEYAVCREKLKEAEDLEELKRYKESIEEKWRSIDFDKNQEEYRKLQLSYEAVTRLISENEYVYEYKEYLQYIQEEEERLLSHPLFNKKGSFFYHNIRKTAEDYGKISADQVQPVDAKALTDIMEYQWTDYFILFGMCAVLMRLVGHRQKEGDILVRSCQKGRAKLTFARIGVVFFFSMLLVILYYGAVFAVSVFCNGFHLQDLKVPIYSIPAFQTLPSQMSIVGFLGWWIVWRVGIVFALSLLFWMLFQVFWTYTASVMAAAALFFIQYGMYRWIGVNSNLNLLKYINVCCVLDGGSWCRTYKNLDLFGRAVGCIFASQVMVVLLAAVLIGAHLLYAEVCYPKMQRDLFPKIRKKLSCYTRKIQGRSLLGTELYKSLILERGIWVFAALLLLLSECVAAHPLGVSQETILKDGYYDRWGGQITEETIWEIEQERKILEDKIEQMYAEVEADPSSSMWLGILGEYSDRLEVLLDFQEEAKEAIGKEGYLVNPRGYIYLLSQKSSQRKFTMIAVVFLAILSAPIMSYENHCGMKNLLESTKNGRKRKDRCKQMAASFLGIAVGILVYGAEYYNAVNRCEMKGWWMPVQSLAVLESFPIPCSIFSFYAGLNGIKLLLLILIANGLLLITKKCKTLMSSYLICISLTIIPSIFLLMGFEEVKYGSLIWYTGVMEPLLEWMKAGGAGI